MNEAMKLAPILRGMCEGGGEDEGVDIYADDYSAGDGDVFVMRAAQLLEQLAAEVTNLRAQTSTARGWLQYYADGAHFIRHDETAWETVSGEPENFQEDEACTATVEDGSMAKLALMQMDGFVKGIPKPGEFHKLYAEWQSQQMSGIAAAPAQPETWKVLPSPTGAPPLDDELRDILGRPCFTLIGMAQMLRSMGHDIKRRAEDEQAVSIHWMLDLYMQHGSEWRTEAARIIQEFKDGLSKPTGELKQEAVSPNTIRNEIETKEQDHE